MFHHKEEKSIHKHNYIYSFLHVNKYFNKIFNDIRIKPNNFYNKNSYFDINNNLYFHSSEKFYPFDITYYSKPLILNNKKRIIINMPYINKVQLNIIFIRLAYLFLNICRNNKNKLKIINKILYPLYL